MKNKGDHLMCGCRAVWRLPEGVCEPPERKDFSFCASSPLYLTPGLLHYPAAVQVPSLFCNLSSTDGDWWGFGALVALVAFINSPVPLAADLVVILYGSRSKGKETAWVTSAAFFLNCNEIHVLPAAFVQAGSSVVLAFVIWRAFGLSNLFASECCRERAFLPRFSNRLL